MTPTVIDYDRAELKTAYCITTELRDVQVLANLPRFPKRLQPGPEQPDAKVAVVCYGPSLRETWEELRGGYDAIFTCSGAHRFLLERDVVPTYHLEVDPRLHKAELMGAPDARVKYLMSSCCHPRLMDLLQDHDVTLWHVFTGPEDAENKPLYPRGEWALMGGANVGLRALVVAYFMGYRRIDLYGMDYSFAWDGQDATACQQHAGAHPNEGKAGAIVEAMGHRFLSSAAMVTYCRQFFHEVDQLPGITLNVKGTGLLQAKLAERLGRSGGFLQASPGSKVYGQVMRETISAEYAALNRQLHEQRPDYGAHGSRYAETVRRLIASDPALTSVLDYGCGKGTLARALDIPIWEYDPAIPGKDMPPRSAALVICTDVLEHVEPEKLKAVLRDLQRVTRKIGYFVINTAPAQKRLPDGRNTHLIQRDARWWRAKLGAYFRIGKIIPKGKDLHVIVEPRAA